MLWKAWVRSGGGGGPAAVRVRCTGGTAGQVTGTVTLGALRAAPHRVHLAGPQHRGSWFLWTLDISALRVSSRNDLADRGRVLAA